MAEMTELQLKIWEVATAGGEPQHRRSFVCGEVVEAMGFTWDGDPIGSAPKPKPVAVAVPQVVEAPNDPTDAAPLHVTGSPASPVEAAPVVEPVAEEPDPTPDDPNPKPDETPVEELGLTAGVVSALKAANVNTAGECRAAETAGTLAGLPGIGPAKLAAIRAALA